MAKHTAGPWVACDWGYIVTADPTGRHEDIYIAEICREDEEGRIVPPIEQQANARLIAAAPDMLQALRDIAAATTGYDSEHIIAEIQGICARIGAKVGEG